MSVVGPPVIPSLLPFLGRPAQTGLLSRRLPESEEEPFYSDTMERGTTGTHSSPSYPHFVDRARTRFRPPTPLRRYGSGQ